MLVNTGKASRDVQMGLAINTFQKIKVMILYKQVINSQCNEPCTQHGLLYWEFLGFGLK